MRTVVVMVAMAFGFFVVGVSDSMSLPDGYGLAARYPGDVGIASDPAVIFADDFESYANASNLWNRYDNVFQGANVRIASEAGNFFGGSKALEFTIPITTAEVANSVAKIVSPELDVLFLRFYAKYNEGFNILGSSHNGAIISAKYCCPGVRSDGSNKFLVSYEASRFEAAAANPGELNAYVYHPDMRDRFGDHFHPTGVITPFSTSPPFTFGPEFIARPAVTPALGRWQAYELMVKANTPGQRDGRIALWLDGNLVAEFPNLRFRDTASLKIDRFTLDLHAGSTNAVAKKWYDNVVAATSYIGPMVTTSPQLPSPPTNLRIVATQ